ncbi:hypothetical protein [Snodgrassella sp. CFCC 13594]|uniref:hypothetical protein n=1 Tax=Snodgrassella sp. CFCC 13594 TaxID=1775559 RepID=UPI00082CDBC5|nr:hypothetical protein [Snodgrassella sp. CFCC 13594]
MMDIKEFINQEKPIPRSSKLDPYRSDILELHRLGYNLNQILKFLESNKLVISKPALQRFIKARLADQVSDASLIQEKQVITKPEQHASLESIDDEVARRPSWASKTPLSELI